MFLVGSVLLASAQDYHVTTDPQQKGVLLEEFTGIYCPNCPDGHKVAAELLLAQPDYFHAISVHAGAFATPRTDVAPDYITDEGTTLNDYFNVTSYPSGMINRRAFDGATAVYGRSIWASYAKIVNKEIAPVNLWIQSSYDKDTHLLTVDVEGYFTETIDEQTALTVALTQSNIHGPQYNTGGLVEDYEHKHMLRDYLTPMWGDVLTNSTAGTYFVKQYQYDVPEKIGEVPTVPIDFEIVAFVTKDKQDVLNVISVAPSCEGIEVPIEKIEISEYKIPISRNYGYNFFELYMTNNSTTPITEATFEVNLNGNVTQVSWTGTVAARSIGLVTIPVDWNLTQIAESNTYSVRCVGVNGLLLTSNELTGEFGKLIDVPASLKVIIKTDRYAGDNTFYVRDADGHIVKEFGPYPDEVIEEYEDEVTLAPNGIYCFEINDAWDDGMMTPRGRFRIYDSNGTLLAQQMEIDGFGYRLFVKVAETNGIEQTTTESVNVRYDKGTRSVKVVCEGDFTTEIFSATGLEVSSSVNVKDVDVQNLRPGVYIVNVHTQGYTYTNKIIVN